VWQPASTNQSPEPKPFNLFGLWRPADGRGSDKDFYEFGQFGGELHIRRPSPDDPQNRFTWLVSNQLSRKKIVGKSLGGGSWAEDEISVLDPDHVALKNGVVLARRSMPKADDAPCDRENSTGVWAAYADARAGVAYNAKDYPLSFCWINIAAKQGDPNGEAALGMMLHDGIGTAQDLPQAFHWTEEASKQGNQTATLELASMYEKGEGTARNVAKAQQIKDAIAQEKMNAMWSELLHGNSQQAQMGRLALQAIFAFSEAESRGPDCEKFPRAQGCPGWRSPYAPQ
jgi:hypothetical protein